MILVFVCLLYTSVAHSKRWLVAIVRIYHEKKTSERLTKMGVENFLPTQQEVHKWSDRRKVVDRVVLPMMIFVPVSYTHLIGNTVTVEVGNKRMWSCRHPFIPMFVH